MCKWLLYKNVEKWVTKTVRFTVFCHPYSQSLCAWKVSVYPILFLVVCFDVSNTPGFTPCLIILASHDCHWDTMLINLLALGFHIYEVLCWHFMLLSVVIYWRFLSVGFYVTSMRASLSFLHFLYRLGVRWIKNLRKSHVYAVLKTYHSSFLIAFCLFPPC